MRGLLIATLASAGLLATPALAQHHGGGHPGGHSGGHMGSHPGGQWHGGGHWQGRPGGSWHWNGRGHRWGGMIGGHWHGGMRAPGGWAAYRRPVRGWVLPSYWVSPGWTVWDWTSYGLYAPPQGYSWSRYYDDAVLIDRSGQVWDSRGDVDWGAYDQDYDDGYGWDEDMEGPLPPPPPSPGFAYPDVEVMRGGVPVAGARVETTCVGDCGGVVEGGYFYPPATETTITIPPCANVVTTTTTTRPATRYVIEEAAPAPRKTVRKVRKVIRR
jgi:Ni/Co efflux regulator RcnB